MEDFINEDWLHAMQVGLEQAIADGDYVFCQKIIGQVKDEGFDTEAYEMKNLLLEATLGDFLIESPFK